MAAAAVRYLERLRSGRLEIVGSMSFEGREVPVSGEHEFAGSDFRSVSKIGTGDSSSTTITVSVAGESFTSQNDGPFFVDDGAQAGSAGGAADPQATLRALRRLRDDGPERRDGRTVHRLVLPPGSTLDARDLGVDDPAMTDVQADVEVWAEPDGTPVEMVVSLRWNQASDAGPVPAEMTLGYRYSDLNSPVSIERPTEVWRTHVSERYGYSIGYPEDWDVEEIEADDELDEFDSFLSPEGIEVLAFAEPGWSSLNEYATGSVYHWQDELGKRPEANEAIDMGGERGRLLTYHGELDGADTFLLDAITVREGQGYTATWFSLPGDERNETARFRLMLSTFEFR